MAPQCWLLLILGTGTIALVPAARQSNQESLRSALDAVVRKQKFLDEAETPEYYNELHSFKYHGGDADRKFDRDFDEDDEEFLTEDNGQLETMGEDIQGLNKLFERLLHDYLDDVPEQEEPVASIFRERELQRSSSHKQGGASDRLNLDDKDLARFVEKLQDGSLGRLLGLEEMDDDDYLIVLQKLYDRYRAGRGNKVYETAGPMSWGELLSKNLPPSSQTKDGDDEFMYHDQDQNILYPSLAQRRNVNGRYPIGRELGSYRRMAKRYSVAKRSPTQSKSKTTDAKVAQDLGALFGTQTTDVRNYTHKSDRDHEHDHEHGHDHDHDHDHDHHGNTSEAPLKVTSASKEQKMNDTKEAKSKFLQVRKKSVDWSQYFGIDRRKKKASFMAGQGTQNQDDEWMLQRYYENMAENLKPKEDDENERKDKLEQMDSKLKYMKDLIIKEALRYANLEDEADVQKVKDRLISRMAAAYSLQKMRKVLSDLRDNVAAQKEAQKAQKDAQNLTSNFRENSANANNGVGNRINDKRSDIANNVDDVGEFIEEIKSCPELEAIEWRCRTVDNLAGDTSRMLYAHCVKLQICKACAQNEETLLPCLANYAVEAGRACDTLDSRKRISTGARLIEEKQSCANAALLLSQLQPPTSASTQCRVQNARDSCLWRYYARYEHRYLRTSPIYSGGQARSHHAGALDVLQHTMSER